MRDPAVLRAHLFYSKAFLVAIESGDWINVTSAEEADNLTLRRAPASQAGALADGIP